MEERFIRMEAFLMEHGRILQALPDAIRERMGFKPFSPQPQTEGSSRQVD